VPSRYAQDHRQRANGERNRQAVGDQVVHALAERLVGRAEIALKDAADIVEILLVQWLVEAEFGRDGLLGGGWQLAFPVKWPARGRAHHQEGHGDDGQHGGNGDQQASGCVAPWDPAEGALQG
jgi:hypothetical protein